MASKAKLLTFVFLGCMQLSITNSSALILSGVDTIHTIDEFGFDFIQQKACTTYFGGTDCVNHFSFGINGFYTQYEIWVSAGYSIKMNKINLDSIKTAPPDSVFYKQPSQEIDNIPVGSLRDFIGNCYVIKTGNDPRPGIGGVYYAKIKILNFKVVDSALHKVEMAFLWAFQFSNGRDLGTTGLDTFNLNPPTRSKYNTALSLRSSQSVFKVLGDRLVLPSNSSILPGAFVSVYDLAGRSLGRALVGKGGVVDLREVRRGGVRGVVVVRGVE